MWIRGAGSNAKVINDTKALEFAGTIRGQYIISQALTIAKNTLLKYEFGETRDLKIAEPSNRADMEFLLEAFPLYMIHDVIAKENIEGSRETIMKREISEMEDEEDE